jgi:hypothetical protein
VRDSEAMHRAAKEMDEAREQVRQRIGELDLAAELAERDEESNQSVSPAWRENARPTRRCVRFAMMLTGSAMRKAADGFVRQGCSARDP